MGAVDYIRGLGCQQVGFLVSGPQDRAGYTTARPRGNIRCGRCSMGRAEGAIASKMCW